MLKENCHWKEKALPAGLLILRVVAGVTMATHGYQKVFGGIMPQMIEGVRSMGFPAPVLFAWLAALSEFAGGLLIAAGLFTRVSAFFVFVTMAVAFFVVHANDAFQVKELAFLYGGVMLSLILTGAGRFSLDALCCKPRSHPLGSASSK